PLLFPFIVDTVIAPPLDYTDLFVNEWGVVVFTSEGTTIAGAPDENGNVYYGRQVFGELLVDAPVIWIHGAFFEDATLTVKAVQGTLTALFPDPDATLNNGNDRPVVASWNISAPPPLPRRERPEPIIPPDTPFGWAMGFWRGVPSLDLFSAESGEYMANFLYYEAGIPYWELPDGIFEAKILAGHYAPDGLLITAGHDPQVERIQLIPLPDGSGIPAGMAGHLSDEEACDIICDWAGGNLKSEEITALWQTWEPFFETLSIDDEYALDRRGSDEQWILFPLPWDVVEEISTIRLDVHDSVERNITYNRLFLGLVRLY
ncbi:MAG: hypothetical protein KAH31_10255, partial [Candidatus Sabulitectum sp.]|nr:hypothetical protein [Candidatus Sabulitectum sp.]